MNQLSNSDVINQMYIKTVNINNNNEKKPHKHLECCNCGYRNKKLLKMARHIRRAHPIMEQEMLQKGLLKRCYICMQSYHWKQIHTCNKFVTKHPITPLALLNKNPKQNNKNKRRNIKRQYKKLIKNLNEQKQTNEHMNNI